MRDATPDDLPALAALRRSAGWDAVDWALRAAIDSARGRFVVVTDARGRLVASGSGMVLAPIGFIGNMVVAEPWRRRGVGAAVLEAVTEHLEAAGCRRLELYATPLGRELYARHGFESIGSSATAQVPRGAISASGGEVSEAGIELLEELSAYDRSRFGGYRRELLEMMLTDPARPVRIVRRGGAMAGYAWLRPDDARVGPLLAEDPSLAADLLADAFAAIPGADVLRLNLPPGNRAGARWLADAGVELQPWDGRMARGPQVARRDETIYAHLMGALG